MTDAGKRYIIMVVNRYNISLSYRYNIRLTDRYTMNVIPDTFYSKLSSLAIVSA